MDADFFDRLKPCRMLVLGDVLLDRYVRGETERISPEAPVLVLRVQDEEIRLGGAGAAAAFARGLGAQVWLAGVVGEDAAGSTVRMLCREEGIDSSLLLSAADRPTPQKERFVGRTPGRLASGPALHGGQQLLRVDREQRTPIAADVSQTLVDAIEELLPRLDVILISDYAKGTCTPELLASVIAAAQSRETPCPVLVDPGRGCALEIYRGVDLIKPNRDEAGRLVGRPISDCVAAAVAASELRMIADVTHVIVTLDIEGAVLASDGGATEHRPAHPAHAIDITGAGDMFLAALGVAMASGTSISEACMFANLAAAAETEHEGTVPLSLDQLRSGAAPSPEWHSPKIASLCEARAVARRVQVLGQRVVYTNGCFDLLHCGHVSMLQEAARQGDLLIVGVNSDEGIRKLKGPERPVIPLSQRLQMLAALECVDHVVVMTDDTPHQHLKTLRPDFLVKGGTTDTIIGREVVEAYGGQVLKVSAVDGMSTTQLIEQIQGATTYLGSAAVGRANENH